MNEIIFNVENICKTFGVDDLTKVDALSNISFNIKRGEFTAMIGPSGSGKSTLLNILSGFDTASKGNVTLLNKSIDKMSGNEMAQFRRDHIGFIFQSYNLIPVLTVKENIEYVMTLKKIDKNKRDDLTSTFLESVGLKGMENRFPSQLSGGQQQRVAIARAMVTSPDIVIADEPTANLDSKTGTQLVDMMLELNLKYGTTFIFSTHDSIIMEKAKRLIVLKDGKVIDDKNQ
jgi:putative ABC transport system ATP-binding protein